MPLHPTLLYRGCPDRRELGQGRAGQGPAGRRGPSPSSTAASSSHDRDHGPLLPALLFTVVVTQLPFRYTIYISFTSWDRDHPEFGKTFAGLQNFRAVFRVDQLRSAFTTIELTATVVIVALLLGLGVALLLDRRFRGRGNMC